MSVSANLRPLRPSLSEFSCPSSSIRDVRNLFISLNVGVQVSAEGHNMAQFDTNRKFMFCFSSFLPSSSNRDFSFNLLRENQWINCKPFNQILLTLN